MWLECLGIQTAFAHARFITRVQSLDHPPNCAVLARMLTKRLVHISAHHAGTVSRTVFGQ